MLGRSQISNVILFGFFVALVSACDGDSADPSAVLSSTAAGLDGKYRIQSYACVDSDYSLSATYETSNAAMRGRNDLELKISGNRYQISWIAYYSSMSPNIGSRNIRYEGSGDLKIYSGNQIRMTETSQKCAPEVPVEECQNYCKSTVYYYGSEGKLQIYQSEMHFYTGMLRNITDKLKSNSNDALSLSEKRRAEEGLAAAQKNIKETQALLDQKRDRCEKISYDHRDLPISSTDYGTTKGQTYTYPFKSYSVSGAKFSVYLFDTDYCKKSDGTNSDRLQLELERIP